MVIEHINCLLFKGLFKILNNHRRYVLVVEEMGPRQVDLLMAVLEMILPLFQLSDVLEHLSFCFGVHLAKSHDFEEKRVDRAN